MPPPLPGLPANASAGTAAPITPTASGELRTWRGENAERQGRTWIVYLDYVNTPFEKV